MMRRPLSTRVIERLPQVVHLRTGLFIRLRDRQDSNEFWNVFTAPEYLAFTPALRELPGKISHVLDCGAGIGLFSLLIEHLVRVGLLPWSGVTFTCVEAGARNHQLLVENLAKNFGSARASSLHAAIGPLGGNVEFFESKRAPWSSSVGQRNLPDAVKATVPVFDLGNFAAAQGALAKIDVEGAEYDAIRNHPGFFQQVAALVIEWHAEMGDMDGAQARLRECGLNFAQRGWEQGNRIVELWVRGKP